MAGAWSYRLEAMAQWDQATAALAGYINELDLEPNEEVAYAVLAVAEHILVREALQPQSWAETVAVWSHWAIQLLENLDADN